MGARAARSSRLLAWLLRFPLRSESCTPIARPIFRWRPDRVRGTPSWRESLALAAEIPRARFQEKENPYFRPMRTNTSN